MLLIDTACAEHGFVINCQQHRTPTPIPDIPDPENPAEWYHRDRNGHSWYKQRATKPAETESFVGMYGWYWSDLYQVWWRYCEEPSHLL